MSAGRALRIALVCPYSLTLSGGVQQQVLGLARELRSRGVDARVIAPSDGPPPEPGIAVVGRTVRFPSNGSVAPISSGRAVARRTLEALRVFEPDVVHLHEPLTPGPAHAVLVGTDLPTVGTFHAAHPGRNGWYDAFRLPLTRMVGRLDVRTAVSVEAQRNVEATFGGRCEIVPNGVDVARFVHATPMRSDRPAVVFVGRHEPRKGLAVLLDAWSDLDIEAVLWLVGSGPQTDRLRARGVRQVEWLGLVDEEEKAARLAGARAACFPSVEGESFGVVLLEAMAAGAPIVASDLFGYRNVARHEQEAILAAPGDPVALRAALRRVLTDPSLAEGLRARGRARVAEFSFGCVAESFVEIYERATHRPRATRRLRARGV